MKRMAEIFDRYMSILLGAILALISILIFLNVGLRYLFNSGLVWAEECTRFLFVWAVFLGAVLALKDNNHLGFTSVVKAMPTAIKKTFFVSSNIMIIGILVLLLIGGYEMIPIGMMNRGAATGIPMAVMYAVTIPMSIMMLVMVAINIYTALFVKDSIDGLIALKESEEEVEFK